MDIPLEPICTDEKANQKEREQWRIESDATVLEEARRIMDDPERLQRALGALDGRKEHAQRTREMFTTGS